MEAEPPGRLHGPQISGPKLARRETLLSQSFWGFMEGAEGGCDDLQALGSQLIHPPLHPGPDTRTLTMQETD